MPQNDNSTKMLDSYLSRQYPVQLSKQSENGDEYWLAEIPDLPGCMSDGCTPDEAVENLEDAKRLWIETQLEEGQEIPEPSDVRGYSGKFLIRMPKSLHRRLAFQAKRENVSLNQYVLSLLSGRFQEKRTREEINKTLNEVVRLAQPQNRSPLLD